MGNSKPSLIINCIVEAYSPKQVVAEPSPFFKHNKIRGALRRIRFALQHKNKIFSILSYDKLCLATTLQAIEINALLSLDSTLMHL